MEIMKLALENNGRIKMEDKNEIMQSLVDEIQHLRRDKTELRKKYNLPLDKKILTKLLLKIINTKFFTGIVINNIMKQFSMIKNSLKKIFKNQVNFGIKFQNIGNIMNKIINFTQTINKKLKKYKLKIKNIKPHRKKS